MDLHPTDILPFIETHRAWAPLIFGVMAFGESLAFIGMLIPATVIMMACGTLIGTGTLHLSDLWIGGALGAILGDSVSYSLGRWLGPRAAMMGPLKRRPQLMTGAERFFARWGWAAVFFGRFIGPMRALVPLAAGILGMPATWFQVNNIISAIVWIPVVVSPGIFTAWLVHLGQSGHLPLALGLGGAALALLVAGAWAMRRYGGRLSGNS